jgi:hypothetical protein
VEIQKQSSKFGQITNLEWRHKQQPDTSKKGKAAEMPVSFYLFSITEAIGMPTKFSDFIFRPVYRLTLLLKRKLRGGHSCPSFEAKLTHLKRHSVLFDWRIYSQYSHKDLIFSKVSH